jgi:fructose-specific phosphotransferase system IIA component
MDFLSPDDVILDLRAADKKSAVTEMVELLKKQKKIKDSPEALDTLLQREKLGSTGIGQGVAIPHSRCNAVSKQIAALAISRKGVEFESLDGEPVSIIFLLLCPEEANSIHLQAMARISRLLKDKLFRQSLIDAKSVEEVCMLITQADAR